MLGGGGPVARALGPGYEPRGEQVAMAGAVWSAMEGRAHLLAEAGTGVGKSFAYLAPAMARAALLGEVVVVATNTIALQEQLIHKDIPMLMGALGPMFAERGGAGRREVVPVLVKGRGNYVSIRRAQLAMSRADRLVQDAGARRSLEVIRSWVETTEDGSLATLPQLERPSVWDKVQSDSGNCMGRRCPNYNECFYQEARRAMAGANLLVCNHALFFSDLALRARETGFLPRYDHVVLDEAHGVEDVAAEHFGVSLSEWRVQHLLSTLYAPRTQRGYLAQIGLMATDASAVSKAVELVLRAEGAARAFFDMVAAEIRRGSGGESGRAGPFGGPRTGEAMTRRLSGGGVLENPLSPALSELSLALSSLKESTPGEPDKFELNAYALRAAELSQQAAVLVDQSLPGCAYWAELERGEDGRTHRVSLACAPVDVAPILREALWTGEHSVVLTSATLATRTAKEDEPAERAETAFAHAMARLGCEGARTLQVGSPFDYARQVEFYVDQSAPDARSERVTRGGTGGEWGGGKPFAARLAERVLHHLDATDGGAFVLFTSFATLSAVARELARPLEERGMPMYVQGQSGSRAFILEQFRADERSVLLGAASFWQGVDVRGRGLRNVIITKLPFDPPDRPLTQARLERIEAGGGDGFLEDSLPRAVIRFKQGFGRLIRSREDRGRVVVLDPRIVTTRYGRAFLAALPAGVVVRTVVAEEE